MISKDFVRHMWVSPLLIALYAPISFLSVPVALINTPAAPSGQLAVAVFATGAATGLLMILMLIEKLTRSLERLRILVFFGLVLAVGAIRGATLIAATNYLSIEDTVSVGIRILNSTLNTALWVLVLASLIALVRANIERYEIHFAERSLRAATSFHHAETNVEEQIDSLPNMQSLRSNLSRVLVNLGVPQPQGADYLLAAAAIRSEIENSLRPFSHLIWFSESLNRPRLRGWQLVKDAFSRPKYAPLASSITLGLWFGIGAIAVLPWHANLIATAVCAGALYILTSVASRADSGTESKPYKGVASLIAISMLNYLATGVAIGLTGGDSLWINPIVSAVLFPVSNILFLAVVSTFLHMRDSYQLIEDLLESAATLASSRLRTNFASYLHNSLQAELASLASQLERAAAVPDYERPDLLGRLEELSNRSIGEDFTNRILLPLERLERVVEAWTGIIDVRLPLEGFKLFAEDLWPVLVEMVEESIANAVRHSGASWIEFNFQATADGGSVIITSPGRVDAVENKSFGGTWLQANSKGVSVEQLANGTRITRVTI